MTKRTSRNQTRKNIREARGVMRKAIRKEQEEDMEEGSF